MRYNSPTGVARYSRRSRGFPEDPSAYGWMTQLEGGPRGGPPVGAGGWGSAEAERSGVVGPQSTPDLGRHALRIGEIPDGNIDGLAWRDGKTPGQQRLEMGACEVGGRKGAPPNRDGVHRSVLRPPGHLVPGCLPPRSSMGHRHGAREFERQDVRYVAPKGSRTFTPHGRHLLAPTGRAQHLPRSTIIAHYEIARNDVLHCAKGPVPHEYRCVLGQALA
mmetsp:Transcript_11886/g.33499  ORF Transcript_11886/g.33499 Transcript_11886/m.33499 type:complete len:219 (-) Transcript_11886:793-1449(-)